LFTITDRKYPLCSPVYEKLQIYHLQPDRGDDWSFYIDSDALVHPDFFDPTEFITKDIVMHNGNDLANNRWKYDDYFRRDGRHIGSCNWFTIGSNWCRDLWEPLPDHQSYIDALEHIYPTRSELNTIITREHLIDDYVLSRNIAKYGLHFKNIIQLKKEIGDVGEYFWHQYTITADEKIKQMKEILKNWGIMGKNEQPDI